MDDRIRKEIDSHFNELKDELNQYSDNLKEEEKTRIRENIRLQIIDLEKTIAELLLG